MCFWVCIVCMAHDIEDIIHHQHIVMNLRAAHRKGVWKKRRFGGGWYEIMWYNQDDDVYLGSCLWGHITILCLP